MNNWYFTIDIAKCHDCNNCFLACKDEFVDNDFPPYSLAQPNHGHRWMNILRKERGQYPKVDVAYLPLMCMQCDQAPCIDASKDGAVYKREDGIVLIDPEKARGQDKLPDACHYGAIWWNAEKNLPQKCTFCAHLLDDGWKEPRCVQACPTGALQLINSEDAEMDRIKESENLEIYKPEFDTSPRVYFKNLFRYTQAFIAGNIVFGDTDECAEGAVVTISRDSDPFTAETAANNYGDFKVDGLTGDGGTYRVDIVHEGYPKQSLEVELSTSINLGTIFL